MPPLKPLNRRGRVAADEIADQETLNASILHALRVTVSAVDFVKLPGMFGIYESADFMKKRGAAPELASIHKLFYLLKATLEAFHTGKVSNPPLQQSIDVAIRNVGQCNPDNVDRAKLAFWLCNVIRNATGHAVVLARYADTRFLFRLCKSPDNIQMSCWCLIAMLREDFDDHIKTTVANSYPHCVQFMVTSGMDGLTPSRSVESLCGSLSETEQSLAPARAQPVCGSSSHGLRPLPQMFCQPAVALVPLMPAPSSPPQNRIVRTPSSPGADSVAAPKLRALPGMFLTDQVVASKRPQRASEELGSPSKCPPVPAKKAKQRQTVAAPAGPKQMAVGMRVTTHQHSEGKLRVHFRTNPASGYITLVKPGSKPVFITQITAKHSPNYARLIQVPGLGFVFLLLNVLLEVTVN